MKWKNCLNFMRICIDKFVFFVKLVYNKFSKKIHNLAKSLVMKNIKMELDNNYNTLLNLIKVNIQSTQTRAIRKVNYELTNLYLSIGQLILEQQKINSWGKSIVEQLAKDLKKTFPNSYGFSARNLWEMRRFYERYQKNLILQQLVAEIQKL